MHPIMYIGMPWHTLWVSDVRTRDFSNSGYQINIAVNWTMNGKYILHDGRLHLHIYICVCVCKCNEWEVHIVHRDAIAHTVDQ